MDELKVSGKPFVISKWEVQEAYRRVKANKGAAGVDGVSLMVFEEDLNNNRVTDLGASAGQEHPTGPPVGNGRQNQWSTMRRPHRSAWTAGCAQGDRDQGDHTFGQRRPDRSQHRTGGHGAHLQTHTEPFDGVDEPLAGQIDRGRAAQQQKKNMGQGHGTPPPPREKVWRPSTHRRRLTSVVQIEGLAHPQDIVGLAAGDAHIPACRQTSYKEGYSPQIRGQPRADQASPARSGRAKRKLARKSVNLTLGWSVFVGMALVRK